MDGEFNSRWNDVFNRRANITLGGTMNKREILNEINKTKEHLTNLEKMLAECEYERFKPKIGEEYYCIDDDNKARRVDFKLMNAYDRDRIKAYNCFRTKEEAEAEAEKILVRRMLEDIAKRLNKERRIDWDDFEQSKYNVGLYYGGIATSLSFSFKIQGAVYCLDENFKDIAIQEIGEERLKRYLGGE